MLISIHGIRIRIRPKTSLTVHTVYTFLLYVHVYIYSEIVHISHPKLHVIFKDTLIIHQCFQTVWFQKKKCVLQNETKKKITNCDFYVNKPKAYKQSPSRSSIHTLMKQA